MRTLCAIAAIAGASLAFGLTGDIPSMSTATARTYEHLANAIIAIRQTEDDLVRGILLHNLVMAQRHLDEAMETRGTDRTRNLEAAAEAITDIANEGDKQVQAIRQRLLKSGHHHHTDADTEDDYIFVDSKEKQALLALAMGISKIDPKGSDTPIRQADSELSTLFARVIAEE